MGQPKTIWPALVLRLTPAPSRSLGGYPHRLDLTDELAEQYFLGLINESLNALAPKMMEYFHQISVAIK